MAAGKLTVVALAKRIGVSRAALYYQPRKPPSDEALRQKIVAVMEKHPAYGSRRVATELKMNRKHIKRVMNAFGLRPRIRRGFKPGKPDDQNRPETHIPNILKVLCPLYPNVVWAGDFTYFWFQDRFWYLATVIDVRSREILGWHIANHHTTALVIEAFKDAARRTKTSPQWFHSDQGSEYVAGAYESLLAEYGTRASQSRKASPWQNGYQESFYSQFKLELENTNRFNNVGELIEAIYRQIRYYNNDRIHSAHDMPPAAWRIAQEQKMTANAVA
jgi:transposase InsO family protein